MRIVNLVVLVGSMAVPGLTNEVWADELQNARSVLEECSAYSQAGMRDCLANKSRESAKELRQAEDKAIGTLSKWDEDAKYIALAKARLKASNKEYEQYRETYCAFASSLGGGAIGNALEIRRLACLFELNTSRALQLQTLLSPLPN